MVNMIAAGEVIERPASVVKELMENSIDAGASYITVAVEDGGRKLISVTDDGCGMDADDLALAFSSHTTSKLRSAADLLNISTLGFRGEALASIASVGRVKAVSRPADSIFGNCIEIDCGNAGPVSPCSGEAGTTIEVRDIFYKLPGRRKFLRTANTEMDHIVEQFIRIALGQSSAITPANAEDQHSRNNGLELRLIHNGRELYHLPAAQSLAQRVCELFPTLSADFTADFIESRSIERGLQLYALLGKPSISRTSTRFQYIFLNGRFIRDKFISHAIKEAYRGLTDPDRSPVVFLFMKMPYDAYDVNVHPTKTEVRFYNANLLHSQIIGCLREKLLGTDLDVAAKLPAMVGPQMGGSEQKPYRQERITDAMADFFRRHAAQTQHHIDLSDVTYARRDLGGVEPSVQSGIDLLPHAGSLRDRRFLQIHDSFIVAQTDDGFAIIDQHALHERILYEQLRRRINAGNLESQRLLIPQSLDLTGAQGEITEKHTQLIEKLGIELVPFGPGTVAIQAFPTLLAKAEPLDFVRDLVELLDSAGTEANPDSLLEEVLNMAACKAAVKAGQRLTDVEIEHLLANGQSVECSSRCPHGRPTTIRFTLADLERQFGRT
jgi:DNA mismatch repair protein MutL